MRDEHDDYINIEGWFELAKEVVRLAANDYRFALRRLIQDPESRFNQDAVAELEAFFREGWFHLLYELDGDELILALREEVGA